MTSPNTERAYYRRWPLNASPFDITSHTGEAFTVQPGNYVRSDLLIGQPIEVRARFELAIKQSQLPIEDPHSFEGANVIATQGDPRVRGAHLTSGAVAVVEPDVALVVMGPHGHEVAERAAKRAHVPVAVIPVEEWKRAGDYQYVVYAGDNWIPTIGWLYRLLEEGEPEISPAGTALRWTTERIADGRPQLYRTAPLPTAPAPHVFVIVTSYGRPDVVVPCLLALRDRTQYERWGLIVLDDGSSPTELGLIRAAARAVAPPLGRHFVVNRHNVGYLETANRAAALAMAQGADAMVFLNSDVLVTPGWLTAMVRAQHATGAALVNPLCNDAGAIGLPFAGQEGSPYPRLRGGVSYLDVASVLRLSKPTYPPAVTSVGNCMLVTADAWRTHGPFNPIYGRGYGEECELWAQVLKAGGKAVVADDAYVYHVSHASHGAGANEGERAGVALFKSRHGQLYEAMQPDLTAWPRRCAPARARVAAWKPPSLPVQFLAVDVGPFGGAFVLLRLVHELRELGISAQMGHLLRKTHDTPASYSLLQHRDEGAIGADFARTSGWSDGIIVATHWSTGTLVERVTAANPGVVPAAFWQDVESRFEGVAGAPALPPSEFAPYVRIPERVVNSMWVGTEADREFNLRSRWTYIPVGIDTLLFRARPELRKPAGPVRVLGMWRPSTSRRGHDLLARVYAELRERFGGDVSLELYGWPDQAPAGVVHHGRMPQPKLAHLMAQVDVFVEPSRWQGFGLPGAEAMASGACLVSADTGGVHAYATHNVNALISSHAELVEHVARVVADADLRQRLSDAAPRAIASIDWRIVGARWALWLAALWRRDRGGATVYEEALAHVEARAALVLRSAGAV